VIPRLFAITPGDGRDPVPWVRVLGDAGIRGLLVRGQSDSRRWVSAARDAGFSCVFAHVRDPGAVESGADGLHLPDGDRPPPDDCPWSRSTHSAIDARRALAEGAAFAALSPIWSPSSKPEDRRPTLGIAGLLAAGHGPVLALGGVEAERLSALRAAGGYGALVLGLFATLDLDLLRDRAAGIARAQY
jgi:thiamine monophosphate synthase